MKTYFINGNSMHLAGSQIDISDNFFGSESPESNTTDAQRQDAIRFWLSEKWMESGDVVVWDGVEYGVPVPNTYKLPTSYTGLDADLDNCDPPAVVCRPLHKYSPMSDGCVERYRTTDGEIVDISIDSVDFADWFQMKELEEEK